MDIFGRLMIGVEGETLTDADCERLSHPAVGGAILFAHNYRDVVQVADLVSAIREVSPRQLLVAVDQEGGRIQRFRGRGFTDVPSMRTIGELFSRDSAAGREAAELAGFVIAAEIRSAGLDLSFAPVLDLDHGRSEIIGNRSFSKDSAAVSVLAQHFVEGALRAGMSCVGKHFPGHGFAELDSHEALPEDPRELEDIARLDLLPFADLAQHAKLGAVMTAHIVYSKIDEKPATFSKIWLGDILRDKLGFQGLVVSDDLVMKGAASIGGLKERFLTALESGCDVALICRELDECRHTLDALDVSEADSRANPWLSLLVDAQLPEPPEIEDSVSRLMALVASS